MKRALLWTILLSLITISAWCQTQVNTISKHNNAYATYRDLFWQKDTLFVTGVCGFKATLAKFSKEGILLETHYLLDTSSNFDLGYWDKGLFLQDTFVFHVASKRYGTGRHHGLALKLSHFNTEIVSKEFQSVYNTQDSFFRIKDFKRIDNGFVFLATERRNISDIQSCLLVTDTLFNLKWRKCYGSNTTIEIPNEVWPLSNGNFIVLSSSSNLDISEQYYGPGSGFQKGYIFEVDTIGTLLWEWLSPEKSEASYSGFLQNDSTIIVAAGYGNEICSGNQSNDLCFFQWYGGAFAFDLSKRQKIWETSISPGSQAAQFDNRYYDIIESVEKDGFILCGSGYDVAYEGCAQIDTTIKCWFFPGVIAKISTTGDSLWMRKYFGVTDIWESNFLYSASIAPDSGYSFVGEAFNPWPGSDQGQFGWLLMTDKYGCIVPGCHLVSSVNENSNELPESDIPFKLYPNPVKEVINILITESIEDDSYFILTDQYGYELGRWKGFEKGATYMIPIQNYVPGLYYVTLVEKGLVVKTEKIVVVN